MKNTKKTIVKTAALCAIALSIGLVSGCSSTAETGKTASHSSSSSTEKSDKSIAVIVKSKSAPEYWDVVNNGAKDAGAELGYDIILDAPATESDIADQIKMVEDAVAAKRDAIVIAPITTDDLNECIQKARDAGVPVVTVDARCSLDDIVYIGTDNQAAGGVAGREAKTYLNGTKNVAVIALAEGSAVSDQRSGGFIEAITVDNDVNIVETMYCNAERDTAKAQALELLDKYSDLEMIYGVNQSSTLGICEAITERGLEDTVSVIGFDSCDEEIAFLESGALDGFVVQSPYNMGYLGVRNADKLANGNNVALTVDTGVTFVNKDNLESDEVQLLLYPLGK